MASMAEAVSDTLMKLGYPPSPVRLLTHPFSLPLSLSNTHSQGPAEIQMFLSSSLWVESSQGYPHQPLNSHYRSNVMSLMKVAEYTPRGSLSLPSVSYLPPTQTENNKVHGRENTQCSLSQYWGLPSIYLFISLTTDMKG